MIQIRSTSKPFAAHPVLYQAMAALSRADAMGVIPALERIESLDMPALRSVLRHLQDAGIGRTLQAAAVGDLGQNPAALEHLLVQLNAAMEESPVPEFEWKKLTEVLGAELLASLAGVSGSSLRRYSAQARSTPDPVAARVHLIAMIVGDLAGAYNEAGIRQWFNRNRVQLDGKCPADLLTGEWDAKAAGPARVHRVTRDWS